MAGPFPGDVGGQGHDSMFQAILPIRGKIINCDRLVTCTRNDYSSVVHHGVERLGVPRP